MEDQNSMAYIQPERVGLDHAFSFRCHKGVSCFTQCCRGISIILTPYDILRLKNRLQLPSDEFLAIYTDIQLLEKTDLPVITLKLLDDEKKSCPFVRDDGCLIYEDRPTTCRYYPLGVAALSHKEGADDKDFFFFIKEPHCRGFEERTCWTVREWRQDQGVDIRDEINADWTDLLVRKRSFPANIKLTDQSKQMFFLASYNIDKFRSFVFESSFLKRYNIPSDTIEKIKADEVALLQFALKWLKSILFKTEDTSAATPAEN
ncbi:MAG: YkgJ family cysteine cluster protein [Desulfobacterales bacterium]|jgi:Fe-S-cluster containining protein|nr:YkgJ family cysteine cluster protein [Desulfobacterales bacterium]